MRRGRQGKLVLRRRCLVLRSHAGEGRLHGPLGLFQISTVLRRGGGRLLLDPFKFGLCLRHVRLSRDLHVHKLPSKLPLRRLRTLLEREHLRPPLRLRQLRRGSRRFALLGPRRVERRLVLGGQESELLSQLLLELCRFLGRRGQARLALLVCSRQRR